MRAGLTSLVAATARRLPLRARLFFYRLGPLTGWLRRTLNRAVPTGIQPVRIAAGDLAGSWLVLDLQVDKDLWLGNYEPEVALAVRRFAPTGLASPTISAPTSATPRCSWRAPSAAMDGSSLLSRFPTISSGCGTPSDSTDLESQVVVVPAAVGAQPGPGRFRVHASGGMGRLDDGRRPPGGISSRRPRWRC